MEGIPLSAQATILVVLLVVSGFFAMAETALMACNRYRLRALAQNNDHGLRTKSTRKGALRVLKLLERTDKLLGALLLFSTLLNAAIATLAGLVTVQLFGEEKWILGVGTLIISFLILVFAEITPKVIGAQYADALSIPFALVLSPLLRLCNPLVSSINFFVQAMLTAARLKGGSGHETPPLSQDELRAIVLESTHGVPPQHREILLNLFELEHVTVDDVMTPRGAIEAIELDLPLEQIKQKLATSYHTRLPVYVDDPNNVIGILHQRHIISHALNGELDHDGLKDLLSEPYFIPSGSGIYAQLQFFQDNRQRLGIVVDEYGDILGLVTLEDIIEEIVGKFNTAKPGNLYGMEWADDTALVEGSKPLRDINRALDLDLPTDGPKTLNGLVLEHFEDIPESGVSVKIAGVAMEIIQTQDRAVKVVRIHKPRLLRPD